MNDDGAVAAVEGAFLVLTNLALVPALAYCARRWLFPELAILSVVFLASSTYHMCQAGFVCLLDVGFSAFQLSDHFWVFSALLWVVLFFVGLGLEYRFVILVLSQLLLLLLILEFGHDKFFSAVVIGGIVLIAFLLLAFIGRAVPDISVANLVVALLLIGGGFVLFLLAGDPAHEGNPGDPNYGPFHSAWHVLIMLAVYPALDLRIKDGVIERFAQVMLHGSFEPRKRRPFYIAKKRALVTVRAGKVSRTPGGV